MKVLITGGAGFIGRWVLRTLPPALEAVVVDSLEEQVHGPDARFPDDVLDRATCVNCDVRDTDRWRHAALGADIVVHLAALTGTSQSMHQQRRYVEHNLLGTVALCDVIGAMIRRPRRIVLASSRAVYGEGAFRDDSRIVHPDGRRAAALDRGRWEVENAAGVALSPVPVGEDAPLLPVSIYGLTKQAQEQTLSILAATHSIELLTLRLQNVYGPLQRTTAHAGLVPAFTSGIMHDGGVELFEDGEVTRDFVSVRDVVAVILAGILDNRALGCTLNVGSGTSVTLRELTRLLGSVIGRDPIITCRGRYRLGDVRHAAADISALHETFGPWRPVPLADGLDQYVSWFRAQPRAARPVAMSLPG